MSSALRPESDRLPFRDPALPLSKRIDDVVGRLTLDERPGMLHQYVPAMPRLGIAPFRTGSEALHGVSWLGVATVFPQAVGLGASWDVDLVRQVADAVSTELRAFHYHRPPAISTAAERGANSLQAWAPVLNLLRDPRWGRNEEGYSEDPVHTARIGEAFCRGLSGDRPTYLRAAPVLKRFLAYNNEDDRCTTSSVLRPRVLQEYDLAAFRSVVASGAATGAMAAYNLVNGRPCHASPLIETELRRWAEPTVAVTHLLGEIRESAYTGSANLLVRYLNQDRAEGDSTEGRIGPAAGESGGPGGRRTVRATEQYARAVAAWPRSSSRCSGAVLRARGSEPSAARSCCLAALFE